MPLPGRSASLLWAALLVMAPAVATAQPATPSSDAKDGARKLAERGYELFQAGKYGEAIGHFDKAEQLFHAPPHLLFIARSQAKLGKLLAARAAYDAIVAERLASYAPDAFVLAQQEARIEVAALRTRLPTLELRIRGAAPSAVEVQIDGASVPVARERQRIPVDPGKHTVVARSGAAPPLTRSVAAMESMSIPVERFFDGAPGAPAAGPGAGAPVEAPDEGAPSSLVPPIVAFAVGGVGLGVGAITGAMSLSIVSDIEAHCTDETSGAKRCRPQDEPDADTARTLGTVSTVSFVVGGVGVATGAILLLLRAQDDAPAQPQVSRRASGVTVTPLIGTRFLGVQGRF
ncbi:MAG: hypothetical protein WKG00_07850 [Polyangiaceae bacterium]